MRTRTRLLIFAAVILLTIGSVTVYSLVTGGSVRIVMENNSVPDLTVDDIKVEIDDPSVAEITKIDAVTPKINLGDETNKTADVTFRAKNSGETRAVVYHRSYDEINRKYDWVKMYPELNLRVSQIGTIVETTTLTFSGWIFAECGILIAMGLISVLSLAFFIQSFIKAEFSYSMVAYGGISAYFAFMLLLSMYDTQYFNTFRSFLNNISDTGFWFVTLTFPIMIAFCVLIAISNIWLLRHEGFRPQNMLGIGLAVFWVIGLALVTDIPSLFNSDPNFDYYINKNITYSLAYVLSFLECMLLSTAACAFLSSIYPADRNKDYLIILGCCIRSDGTLTPILRGRVDAAIAFEKKQFSETGKHAKFVPSGGQGADEVISESEAMKRYLIEQGYPEEQIIKEDKSVNTNQNIMFSRDRIMEDTDKPEKVKAGFATTNYHIFRGYILSQKHKLDAQGISAKTKWYFFPNAFLREFAGLLVDKKLAIILIVLLLLIAYTLGVHLLSLS